MDAVPIACHHSSALFHVKTTPFLHVYPNMRKLSVVGNKRLSLVVRRNYLPVIKSSLSNDAKYLVQTFTGAFDVVKDVTIRPLVYGNVTASIGVLFALTGLALKAIAAFAKAKLNEEPPHIKVGDIVELKESKGKDVVFTPYAVVKVGASTVSLRGIDVLIRMSNSVVSLSKINNITRLVKTLDGGLEKLCEAYFFHFELSCKSNQVKISQLLKEHIDQRDCLKHHKDSNNHVLILPNNKIKVVSCVCAWRLPILKLEAYERMKSSIFRELSQIVDANSLDKVQLPLGVESSAGVGWQKKDEKNPATGD